MIITRKQLVLSFVILIIVLGIPFHFVNANSPAAPSEVWFYFNFDNQSWKDVQGIQLIGCPSETCDEPILLNQYGICTNDECLKSQAVFDNEGYELKCANNSCLSIVYPNHGGLDFKVFIQSRNKAFSSQIIKSLPHTSGESLKWEFFVQENSLVVEANSAEKEFVQINNPFFSSWPFFFLSIFTEILIAYFYFRRMFGRKSKDTTKCLEIVMLINFVTLPVVWVFFPALGYFHTIGNLKSGYFTIFVSLINTLLFLYIFRDIPDRNNRFITRGAIALPITIPISFFLIIGSLVMTGYAYPTIVAQGLPAYLIIGLEEIFAVVVEALLMIRLSNQIVPKKHAWILSLIMNTASFFVGQMVQLIFR